MDIKKVITDKYYDKKYISIEDSIYEVEYYKNSHSYLAAEIDKAILKSDKKGLKSARNLVKLEYKPFPNSDKMIEIIEEEKIKIYNKLGLNSIVSENAPIIKAMLLYEYLCKNTRYDMTAQEDTANIKEVNEDFAKFEERIKPLQEKYVLEYFKLKSIKEEKELETLSKSLHKTLAELKAIGKETEYYNNNLFNSIYLRAIYNTIIYHKGVCFNFSYAYPFLLEGSGISTYGVEIFREDGTGGHAFNIIEVMKNENTPKYYIADLTYGNGKKDGSVVEIIESFAINKDKYLNFIKDKKIDKIKILDLKCPHSEIMFKDLSPEPLFSAMCTKMEDITSLTKAKQQTIKHILERDIVKPIENGLER